MKKFDKPELTLIRLAAADVITTSGNEKYEFSPNSYTQGSDESGKHGGIEWNTSSIW